MTWKEAFNSSGGMRDEIDEAIRIYHAENIKRGKTSYGPDFAGEPLEQGFEEAFDLAFYMQTEIKRRDHIAKKLISYFMIERHKTLEFIIDMLEISIEKCNELIEELDKDFNEST